MKNTRHPLLAVLAISVALFSAAHAEEFSQRTVGLTFPDQAQTTFLKAVLESMNLPYTAKETSSGEMVQWVSRDPRQEQESQNRVSQYRFISTQCKGMQLPSPNKPALSQLSCPGK
jgi:hypothetical protein